MKKLKVKVEYIYEIEIDTDNHIVKDYENDDELVEDLAVYQFKKVLPVVESGGVKVKRMELQEVAIVLN